MTEAAGPLELRYSRHKVGFRLAASAGLAMLAAFLVTLWAETGSFAMLSAGIAGLCFFAFASVAFLLCFLDRRVQVHIDAQGLQVRPHSDAIIPLRSLSGVAWRGSRVIFGLARPERFPVTSRWRRFLLAINGKQARGYFGDVWIWTGLMDGSPRDVLNAIHDFRVPTEYESEMRAAGASAKSDIVPARL